jgi:hypothetical protein
MKTWVAVVSLGIVASLGGSAIADDDHGDRNRAQRVFHARLVSYNEVPALSTPARGQFYAVVNKDGTALTYWLTYSGFATNVAQSHIHFGQHHTNGGVSIWLCQGTAREPTTPPGGMTDTPECQNGQTTTPITDTVEAGDVVGPAGQGISAGEFAEILAAMRAGAAYVNVHSVQFGPGEIRGQIE